MQDPYYNENNGHSQGYQDDYYAQEPVQQLDPSVERIRRKLMRLMLISIIITILLVGAVLAAVIYKINHSSEEKSSQSAATQTQQLTDSASKTPLANDSAKSVLTPAVNEPLIKEIDLPVGTRLLSQSISGDLISLETIAPSGGTELVIYNYRQGKVIAKLAIPASDMPTPDTGDDTQQ